MRLCRPPNMPENGFAVNLLVLLQTAEGVGLAMTREDS
jgi:hypothetical protein